MFWPVDYAQIGFLGGTTALLVLFRDVANSPWGWSAANLFGIACVTAIAWKTRTSSIKRATIARMLFSFVAIPIVFTELGAIVPHVNPANWEERLAAFDRAMFFGLDPIEALEQVANPLLTEVLQWVYNYYYFIALILGFAVMKDGDHVRFSRMLFAFILCVYLSYVGYYVIPATGPNLNLFGLYSFETDLPGVFLAQEMRGTMAALEKIKQDCFPSGHTAVSVLALIFAWRHRRRSVPLLVPLVVALVFSTMYLRYHYVADVLAGLILAVVSYHAAEWIHVRWERGAGWREHGHPS